MMTRMNPASKTVLIAGGTGGLGRAVTTAFLDAGARVVSTYVSQDGYDAFYKHLNETQSAGTARAERIDGTRFEGHRVDVTDEAAVTQLVQQIVTKYGRLDAMVNAVGGYIGGVKLWDMETKDWERMMSLNVKSGYVLSRTAVRAMLKQGHGAIVNVASKAAVDHAAGNAAYAASKAAAVAMMDCLAADLRGTGVRANSVLPSIIDTEANRKALPNANFASWPKPEEIARVILWLCSDEARLINGASIPVYGDS
jgi:NAD(P)-dependent dehydrogenase (short-subunit alcohol dehydrogenase family)